MKLLKIKLKIYKRALSSFFVWITDGVGWKSARNKLEEAYNTIPKVYNLTNVESFIKLLK